MKFYNLKIKSSFFIVFLFVGFTSFAQDRVNKILPAISSQVLWSLSQATGWVKNPEGQWLEGKNKIQKEKLSAAEVKEFDKGRNALGFDNFTKIEARDIVVEGTAFVLITKRFLSGFYVWPTSFQGFNPQRMVSFVVIKKNNATFEGGPLVPEFRVPLFYFGSVKDTTSYLTDISLQINKMAIQYSWISTSKGTTEKLEFYYKDLDDKSKCRFFISSSMDIASLDKSNLFLPLESITLLKSILEDIYYEAPKSSLAGLIALIKPSQE